LTVDSVKGILSGTTGILDVYDDSEVRKILEASNQVRELAKAITEAPTRQTINAYISCLTKLGQAIIPLCQLATKRIGELNLDILQIQLKDAIDIIVRESPSMVSSCKLFLADVTNDDNKAVISSFTKRLIYATLQIDLIVQCRDEGGIQAHKCGRLREGLEKRRQLGEELLIHSLKDHFAKQDTVAPKSFAEFNRLSDELLPAIRDYILMISETIHSNAGKAIIENLGQSVQDMQEITRNAPVNYMDDKANHEAKETLKSIQSGFETLEKLMPRALVSELINSLSQLSDIKIIGAVVADFNEVARSKSGDGFQASYDAFVDEVAKVDKLVLGTLNSLEENQHQIFQKIEMKNAIIQGLADSAQATSKFLMNDPKDKTAQENMTLTVKNFTDMVKELQKTLLSEDNVFGAHDLLAGASILKLTVSNEF
jgi:hypothetical protein